MTTNELFDESYYIGQTKSNYDDYRNCRGILETYASMLTELFHPNSVFDAGGAMGFVVDWFNKNNVESKGVDISSWAVSHSPFMYQSDLTKIPEEDNSYEVVTCSEVLGHVPQTDIKKVIKELYRISNKYIVMLNEMWEIPPENNVDPGDITHITFYSRKQWEDIIDKLGYKRDIEMEDWLNNHQFSKSMYWSGRFLVIKK